MSPAPYYTGDNIPLKFTVSDKDGAVNPSAAEVWLLTPCTREHTKLGDATVDGNEVSYTVGTDKTCGAGIYKFYFVLTLPFGARTHKIEREVIHNP